MIETVYENKIFVQSTLDFRPRTDLTRPKGETLSHFALDSATVYHFGLKGPYVLSPS